MIHFETIDLIVRRRLATNEHVYESIVDEVEIGGHSHVLIVSFLVRAKQLHFRHILLYAQKLGDLGKERQSEGVGKVR